ncbi:LPS translocon maturation chaperone LptM [Chthonobacter albigriseus]|uniref:LPS translocon maturation chaperone LptM n=1 Tax=Chthonobacter albigriseus TaxID=1683161 RepID=UPI0015EEFF83|nr:hypothetical protein [Chthonobacter albigriseus]
MSSSALKSVLILTCVAFAAAGCGRKGALEPPGGAPEAANPPSSLIGVIATPASSEEEAAPKPDKPFVLDPLI